MMIDRVGVVWGRESRCMGPRMLCAPASIRKTPLPARNWFDRNPEREMEL